MRASIFVLLLLAGCSCDSDPPEVTPPASAPPTTTAPAAPPTTIAATTTAPTHAPALVPTADEARSQLRLLREGRAAVRAHDLAAAGASFDAFVRANPRDPRALCEAGYVSHLAGHDDQAATRIDLALRLFGDDARITDALRVPMAMCLYNRGLVAEAQDDAPLAAACWQRSLALRPNRSVSDRRDALVAALPSAPTADASPTIGGDIVRRGLRSTLIEEINEAALLDDLQIGCGGEGWDGERSDASIARVASASLTGGRYSQALVLSADDNSAMLGDTSLVIAFTGLDGFFRVVTTGVGSYDATDHGHSGSCDGSDIVADVVEGVFRVRFDITCSESCMGEVEDPAARDGVQCYELTDEGETREEVEVLCRFDGAEPDCVRFSRSMTETRASSVVVMCQDEDGHDVDVGDEDDEDDEDDEEEADAGETVERAYSIDVLPAQRLRITWTTGTAAFPPAGEHAWDAIATWSSGVEIIETPYLAVDQDEEEEGEDEEDEEEEP